MKSQVKTEHTMQISSEQKDNTPADSRFESLSALIDGELSDAGAQLEIRQLGLSVSQLARHAEYIAIGDAMRGLNTQHSGFTHRVMAALENEPVVLAPVVKKTDRRPALWLAAATAAAITWGLWQTNPRDEITPPLAAVQPPTTQSIEAMPYLAAHQDFAQAVISTQEMRFTNASLEIRQ
jgi:negative regulator of sigma E activity